MFTPTCFHSVDIFLYFSFDPKTGRDCAQRQQLPLKVSYAMTIHKSQGSTLPYVEVNCDAIFAPGQLAVAIGRAKTVSGLAIFNFNERKHIIKPRSDVVAYMKKITPIHNEHDNECCLNTIEIQGEQSAPVDNVMIDVADNVDQEPDDAEILEMLNDLLKDQITEKDFDEHAIAQLGDLNVAVGQDEEQVVVLDNDVLDKTQQETVEQNVLDLPELELGDDFDSAVFGEIPSVQSIKHTQPFNDIQIQWNEAADHFSERNGIERLSHLLLQKLELFWEKCLGKKISSPAYTSFFSKVHLFCTKGELKEMCQTVLNAEMEKNEIQVLTSWFVTLRKHFIYVKENVTAKPATTSKPVPAQNLEMSSSAKSKVRYLAGRSVAKTKKKAIKSIQQNLGKKSGVLAVHKGQKMLGYLEHMRTSFDHAMKGPYHDTLDEIERKQNNIGGLTHVTDETFLFYEKLEIQRRKLHTLPRLSKLGEDLFPDTQQQLMCDVGVHEQFKNIFKDKENCDVSVLNDLKVLMLDSFVAVSNNEFRKYASDALGKRKVFHLRHEIHRGSDKKKGTKTKTNVKKIGVEVENVENPKTKQKQKQPRKKKIHDENTRTNLTSKPSGQNKSSTTQEKHSSIKETPSTSKTKLSGKKENDEPPQKEHCSTKESDEEVAEPDVHCPVCHALFPDRKQWIGCDNCDQWYHRTCSNIKKEEWAELKKSNVAWKCINCL